MNDNKLIAEFMSGQHPLAEVTHEAHHNYDTSWDWLMPVIKKCLVGEAEMNEEISNTTIKNIYEGICNQDISQAYKSVITFIKTS
jgi:hypothetical protein|tara:strand:+ start:491 stop:745 length:255 start_codon:yes stop_codon:yes gene_type:complete